MRVQRFGSLPQRVLLPLLTLFLFIPLSALSWEGKVVAVTDGDTISVMREGKAVKVRLAGIDCPEIGQAYGNRAKRFVSDLAFGKEVQVRAETTDKYGRIVGWIMLPDGTDLNREILLVGMGWWYRKYYPNERSLEELEVKARVAKYGLWKDKDPIPPLGVEADAEKTSNSVKRQDCIYLPHMVSPKSRMETVSICLMN